MRIRLGKTQSLIVGVVMLIVTGLGLYLMPGSRLLAGMQEMEYAVSIFRVLWIVIGLTGAGGAFYNAFGRRKVPLYEMETEPNAVSAGSLCPRCGKPVSRQAKFCRNCGSYLSL